MEAIEALVLSDLKHRPGGHGVVAGLQRRGEAAEIAAAGDLEPAGAPFQPTDAFRAASVTKLVTAASVVLQARRGALHLTDRVLPLVRKRVPPAWQGDDGPLATVTLEELLGHRAGLPDYTFHAFEAGFLSTRPWAPEGLVGLAGEMTDRPSRGSFAYSDTGFVLLGMVLERVESKPLNQVFREAILRPFGMEATWLEGHEPARGRLAHHGRSGRDLFALEPTFDWAGGGLATTAADLLRLLRGLEDRGLLAEMGRWGEVPEGHPHRSLRYGLGLAEIGVEGERLVGHGGIWGAFAFLLPRTGTAFAGTVNEYGPFGVAARPLLDSLVRLSRVARGAPAE